MEIEDDKAEEVGTKKQQTGDARPMSGRPPKHESRATEFRRELAIWKQTPISLRPSLHALGDKLGTTHQTLSYHLNRLNRWEAQERAKRLRAEGRPFTAALVKVMGDTLWRIKQEAKRGPLNCGSFKFLKESVRQGIPGAKEILEKCRQMTPEEEKQAHASEKAAAFASAAASTIKRIEQEAERGPLCWQDVERLKYFARRKHQGAKELLQKYSQSALPRPQVPQ